jgi:C-terminal processing protease CtpA/Prc
VQREALRQVRAAMQFPDMAAARQELAQGATTVARTHAPGAPDPQTTSLLPDFFAFRPVPTPSGVFGYIRIYSFMARNANEFVTEFERMAKLLPQNGLIIDVRGNGGVISMRGTVTGAHVHAHRTGALSLHQFAHYPGLVSE